jgi:murein DD-endopeptidase MepM/ murein hydrolase activator NlpD
VAGQKLGRSSRRARAADLESAGQQGLLSRGVAALAIAALGLAVAGSIAVTTSAQTTGSQRSDAAVTVIQPAAAPTVPPVREPRAVRPFAGSGATTADLGAGKSATVRAAIVKERVAQRSEELAKTAEAATIAREAAARDARQVKLSEVDQARHDAAAALIQESVRAAVAARLAATQALAVAEQQGSTGIDVNTVPIPTGGAGVSPVPGAVVGAHFGQYGLWSRYHTGLDFRAAYGTPIRAVKAGVILYAGNSGDWAGNHVAVKHADGTTTMYSHMSSMAAQVGTTVQAGQVIGYVGQTGRAFGAHLHFELYPAGVKYGDVYQAINPQPWLAANGVYTR